jgi:hypothetical protein
MGIYVSFSISVSVSYAVVPVVHGTGTDSRRRVLGVSIYTGIAIVVPGTRVADLHCSNADLDPSFLTKFGSGSGFRGLDDAFLQN